MKNSCNNCNNKITTCSKKYNSRCIIYEGELSDCSELECCNEITLHQVIQDMGGQLDHLCKLKDLSSLGNNCIEYDNEEELNVVDVLLGLETELCKVKETAEETEPCNIFNADISCLELDYKCLRDSCSNSPTTLKDLLQLLIDNTCK